MTRQLLIVAFAAIFVVSFAQKARCGASCKFRFCRADGLETIIEPPGPKVLLRDANVATAPYVCDRVGTGPISVKKAGKAMVYSAAQLGIIPEPFVPIASFRKKPKFPKTYFKLREITRFPPIPGEVGVARTRSGGKFELASDDLCVKLPILTYTTESGETIRTKEEDDCISFRTVVPEILVEATWDSADDFNLAVSEPAGNKGCKVVNDNNVDVCGIDMNGREQYRCLLDDTVKGGTYTVTLTHKTNCGDGKTKWNIAVLIRGKLVTLETGNSNLKDGSVAAEFTFTYP